MRKIRDLLLLLLAALVIGCREEVVEELEDMGFKREWIPFGDAMGLPPLDENYHYQQIPSATPWYVSQLAWNPYLVYVDSTGPGTNKFLRITTESDNAQTMYLQRSENLGDIAGQKIRFSARIRPNNFDGEIAFGYYIDKKDYTDEVDSKLPDNKWSKISFEADIPPDAQSLVIELALEGTGEISIDDCSIERLGPSSKGAAARNIPVEHRNLTFDDGDHALPPYYASMDSLEFRITPWRPYFYPEEYKLILDSSDSHSGRYAGGLKSLSNKLLNGGMMYLSIPAELVRGYRVKYSAWLKANDLNGIVSWRATVFNSTGSLGYNSKQHFDIYGNSEWTEVSGEIDVPANAERMTILLSLVGHGTVLIDDVSFEKVSRLSGADDLVDKSQYFAKPTNLGFEDVN